MHPLTYRPNGALHHLLTGIKTATTGDNAGSCTWHHLHTWARLNPCKAEPVELNTLLDKLAADELIRVTTTGPDGLSADKYSNARIHLYGAGLLKLTSLNMERNAPAAKGQMPARRAAIHGLQNPLDRAAPTRQGADDFRAVQSLTGGRATPYDGAQGLGNAV